jgi:hypothetical protein
VRGVKPGEGFGVHITDLSRPLDDLGTHWKLNEQKRPADARFLVYGIVHSSRGHWPGYKGKELPGFSAKDFPAMLSIALRLYREGFADGHKYWTVTGNLPEKLEAEVMDYVEKHYHEAPPKRGRVLNPPLEQRQ